MLTNPMTEKQAWWTMAVAYGTPRGKRDEKQRSLTRCGICWALWCMARDAGLSPTLRHGAVKKLRRDLGSLTWFCAYNRPNDALRADYCYLNYYMLGGTKC